MREPNGEISKKRIRQLVRPSRSLARPPSTLSRKTKKLTLFPLFFPLENPVPTKQPPLPPVPDRASLAAAAAQRRAAAALFRRTGGTGREPRSRPFGVALMSLPSPPPQQQQQSNEFYYQQQQHRPQQMQYQQMQYQPYHQRQQHCYYQQGGGAWPRAHGNGNGYGGTPVHGGVGANNDNDAWALDGAPELRADQGTQLAASGRLSQQKAVTPLPAVRGGGGFGLDDDNGHHLAPASVRARLAAARAALVANPESADKYGAMRTRTGLTPGGGGMKNAAGEMVLSGGKGDARAVRALLGEMAGGVGGVGAGSRRRGSRRSSEGFGSDYDDEETPPSNGGGCGRRPSDDDDAAAAARQRSSEGGAAAAAPHHHDASAFGYDDFGGGGLGGDGGGGWENEEDDVGGWAATDDVDSSPLSSGGKGKGKLGAAAATAEDGDVDGAAAAAAPKPPRPPRNCHVRLKRALAGRASLAGDGIRVTEEDEADPDAPPGTVTRVRRRSARTKHRPLEWWRCERKEYGRPHRSLPTVRAVVSLNVFCCCFFYFFGGRGLNFSPKTQKNSLFFPLSIPKSTTTTGHPDAEPELGVQGRQEGAEAPQGDDDGEGRGRTRRRQRRRGPPCPRCPSLGQPQVGPQEPQLLLSPLSAAAAEMAAAAAPVLPAATQRRRRQLDRHGSGREAAAAAGRRRGPRAGV